MKQWFHIFCLLAVSMSILYGCVNRNKKDDSSKILSELPYAPVTDSIAQFPQNVALHLERATLLSQHNRHELATADYKKAWELNPGANTALQYISNLLVTDRARDAVALLKECITKCPASTEFHRRLSEVYEQTGQTHKALEQYDELLRKDSSDFESWFEKGKLLSLLKDTAAAIEALKHSYALQPINYTGVALANLYASKRDPQALVLCDELIRKDSSGTSTDA